MMRLRSQMLKNEAGSAMVIALLVMVVLTGMGAVVFAVGTSNLQNAGRDRSAGTADGAAQAGIAQAIEFIRTNGVKTLTCDQPPVAGQPCTNQWGSANPVVVSLGGGKQYSTWIERVQQFRMPSAPTGTYRIHSTGTFTSARPGTRVLTQVVNIKPLSFPLGIYAGTEVVASGTPEIEGESLYSGGCVFDRDAIDISGTDIMTGLPAGVNSTQFITTTNNGTCSSTDGGNIHKPTTPASVGFCNTTFPADRDRQGGPTTNATCNAAGVTNSLFTDAELDALGYGLPRGITDAQYAQLKSKAIEQGYFSTVGGNSCGPGQTPPACWNKPNGATHPNAVLYFQVPAGTVVNLQGTDMTGYTQGTCGDRSLIIVVEGGDVRLTSNVDLVGAIFVPDGVYDGAGTVNINGTLFAKTIDRLTGNHTYDFNTCWLDNFPGGLLDVAVGRFSEKDR